MVSPILFEQKWKRQVNHLEENVKAHQIFAEWEIFW